MISLWSVQFTKHSVSFNCWKLVCEKESYKWQKWAEEKKVSLFTHILGLAVLLLKCFLELLHLRAQLWDLLLIESRKQTGMERGQEERLGSERAKKKFINIYIKSLRNTLWQRNKEKREAYGKDETQGYLVDTVDGRCLQSIIWISVHQLQGVFIHSTKCAAWPFTALFYWACSLHSSPPVTVAEEASHTLGLVLHGHTHIVHPHVHMPTAI